MKGAIIFVIAFVIFLAATLAYPELPPGNIVSNALNIDSTIEWNGVLVKTLISAIFSGVIYAVIIWLIFTALQKTGIVK